MFLTSSRLLSARRHSAHPVAAPTLHPREILRSSSYKTTTQRYHIVTRADNAMPLCHRAGHDRRNISHASKDGRLGFEPANAGGFDGCAERDESTSCLLSPSPFTQRQPLHVLLLPCRQGNNNNNNNNNNKKTHTHIYTHKDMNAHTHVSENIPQPPPPQKTKTMKPVG